MDWPPLLLFFLMVGAPTVGAPVALAARGRPRLATTLAAGLLALAAASWLAAPDAMIALGSLTMQADAPRRVAGAALAGSVLLLLWLDRLVGRGRKFAAVALAVTGAGGGAILITDPRAGAVLLLTASAAALFALLDRPLTPGPAPPRWEAEDAAPEPDLPAVPALEAALKYLALMVLAAVAFVVAFVVWERYRWEPEGAGRLKPVLGFLAVALGLRLGAAPLHAWVGDLLAATPPAAAGLVLVALNGATVFYAAATLAGAAPLLGANPVGRELLLGGALLGGGLAALLAWGQAARHDLRRLLGAAAVAGVAWTLFGLGAGSPSGWAGGLLGALGGGAGLLLALGAGGLLIAQTGTADPARLGGLARRAPALPLALAGGLAAMLGLPPLGALGGRLLVWQAAVHHGDGWPWALGLAGGLALLGAGAARALLPLWLAPANAGAVAPNLPNVTLRPAAGLWLGTLGLLALLLGLAPGPLAAVFTTWAETIPYLSLP